MEPDRILNLRSHVAHRYPAFESCNVDAIPLPYRLRFRSEDGPGAGVGFRYCKRCFRADA